MVFAVGFLSCDALWVAAIGATDAVTARPKGQGRLTSWSSKATAARSSREVEHHFAGPFDFNVGQGSELTRDWR